MSPQKRTQTRKLVREQLYFWYQRDRIAPAVRVSRFGDGGGNDLVFFRRQNDADLLL